MSESIEGVMQSYGNCKLDVTRQIVQHWVNNSTSVCIVLEKKTKVDVCILAFLLPDDVDDCMKTGLLGQQGATGHYNTHSLQRIKC